MKINEQQIKNFVSAYDYDIRKTHNGRFTDQKCTPDVVNAVAECVLEYIKDNPDKLFTKNDIWHFSYASQLVAESFSKPHTQGKTVQHEFDKFFGQPLELLAAARLVEKTKKGTTNIYRVTKHDMLDYIAQREKNAVIFLDIYLTKTMRDSGCWEHFEAFFQKQDKKSFQSLQDVFKRLIWTNTGIKCDKEPRRIFNKIINILAFCRKKRGGHKGHLSADIITLSDIRYNQTNWRDVGKPKGISRQEFAAQINDKIQPYQGYFGSVQKPCGSRCLLCA